RLRLWISVLQLWIRVSVLRIFVLRLSVRVWLQIRTALLCLCRALCAASLLGNAAGPSTQCGVSTLLNDREQRWMCGSSARPSGARFLNAKNPPCHKRDCAAYASGTTAMASISNNAPSRASFDICTAVEAGGALMFT